MSIPAWIEQWLQRADDELAYTPMAAGGPEGARPSPPARRAPPPARQRCERPADFGTQLARHQAYWRAQYGAIAALGYVSYGLFAALLEHAWHPSSLAIPAGMPRVPGVPLHPVPWLGPDEYALHWHTDAVPAVCRPDARLPGWRHPRPYATAVLCAELAHPAPGLNAPWPEAYCETPLPARLCTCGYYVLEVW